MKNSFATASLAFALLLSKGAIAGAPQPSGSAIENFHVVSDGVFRGARPSLAALDELAALHVRTVIDLQGGDMQSPLGPWIIGKFEPGETPGHINWERKETEKRGMVFRSFPLNSMAEVTSAEIVMISSILHLLQDPASLPAYVHCEHGHDRTGMIIALHRVFDMSWTPEAAHNEMVAMGHSGFMDHLVTHAMDSSFYRLVGAGSEWLEPGYVLPAGVSH